MDNDEGSGLSSFGDFMLWVGIIGVVGFVLTLLVAGGG
jgi:hypothetical protein